MFDLLSHFSRWRGKYIIPIKIDEIVKYFKNGFNEAFIMKKYPGEIDFPDEVTTLRKNIYIMLG